jgi:hypothetical protein
MADPIKNRKTGELLQAFKVMEQILIARGLKTWLTRLNNEASQLLKDYLHDNNTSLQLLPPYWHHRNACMGQ